MESRRNGPQLSSRHDDDDDGTCLAVLFQLLALHFNKYIYLSIYLSICVFR